MTETPENEPFKDTRHEQDIDVGEAHAKFMEWYLRKTGSIRKCGHFVQDVQSYCNSCSEITKLKKQLEDTNTILNHTIIAKNQLGDKVNEQAKELKTYDDMVEARCKVHQEKLKAEKKKFKDLDDSLKAELRDASGTIWEHAKKLQDMVDEQKERLRRLEAERNFGNIPYREAIALKERVKELESQLNEAHKNPRGAQLRRVEMQQERIWELEGKLKELTTKYSCCNGSTKCANNQLEFYLDKILDLPKDKAKEILGSVIEGLETQRDALKIKLKDSK